MIIRFIERNIIKTLILPLIIIAILGIISLYSHGIIISTLIFSIFGFYFSGFLLFDLLLSLKTGETIKANRYFVIYDHNPEIRFIKKNSLESSSTGSFAFHLIIKFLICILALGFSLFCLSLLYK